MKKLTHLTFVIILFAFAANAFAQTVTFESAKAEYDNHNYAKAINDFKKLTKQKVYKTNAQAWNFLGLSYRAVDDKKNSLKALNKAVKLAPTDNAIRFNYAVILSETGSSKALGEINAILAADPKNKEAIYLRGITYFRLGKYDKAKADVDSLIELDPTSIAGYSLASDLREQEINMRVIQKHSTAFKEIELLKDSVALFEKGLELCGGCRDRDSFEYYLGIRRMILEMIEKTPDNTDGEKDLSSSTATPATSKFDGPNDKPFNVLSKPRASYTDAARTKSISGRIAIIVIFGASGRIEGMLLKNSLGDGLDENAMNAARHIKFSPPIKDGKPKTIIRTVEYSFTVF